MLSWCIKSYFRGCLFLATDGESDRVSAQLDNVYGLPTAGADVGLVWQRGLIGGRIDQTTITQRIYLQTFRLCQFIVLYMSALL